MAKKNFDDFLDSVEKPRRPSAEEAAAMVAQVHAQNVVPVLEPPKAPKQVKEKVEKQPKAVLPAPSVKKTTSEARKVGRPKTERNETERLYRLSVDLPGSLLLKLKGEAMANDTDMKTYVRTLLAEHLNGK